MNEGPSRSVRGIGDPPAAETDDIGRRGEPASAESPSSSSARAGSRREAFEPFELAAVLSHYDTGVIEQIREFPRGSSKSPKVVIRCERGEFLLKRRAPGRDDLRKVNFSHAVQLHLGARGFPLARLVRERRRHNTLLSLNGRVYELFEFVNGSAYDHSRELAEAAGRELAGFHRNLADLHPDWSPPAGSYHNSSRIQAHMEVIPQRVGASGAEGAALPDVIAGLQRRYTEAARRAELAGVADWPQQVIHGDWHPGNMLFRGPQVIAVLDFDSVRMAPRALDIAGGALQFSISMQGDDPDIWPIELDEDRFLAFCHGYDRVSGCTISTAEIEAVPWLMIESLIVEAVIPIAATGSFATLEGGAFIRMVGRKVDWIESNARRLADLIAAG
ncbi:MAG: hypothetical protein EA376_02065 [Phycisphaeraceae bacterium]|nr:MAG: hypothetical protein EA376_02065 [Phycisphaeraceae bacterium]